MTAASCSRCEGDIPTGLPGCPLEGATLGRVRSATALPLLLLALLPAACVIEASLEGRACDREHPCLPEWHCSAASSICVRGPAPALDGGTRDDAGEGQPDDAGTDAGLDVDAGRLDGGALDGGTLDGGPGDGGDELDAGTSFDASGEPVRLHNAMAPGQGVVSFAVLPDASGALVLGDLSHPGRHGLFRVRFDGTAPAALSPDSTFGDVIAYELSPEGDRVLFLQDIYEDNAYVLLLADIASGGVALVGEAAGDERIWPFAFSGDGQHAIWRKDTRGEEDLFARALPPEDGAARKLDQTSGSGGKLAFATAAGVPQVAVLGDLVTPGDVQLHAVDPSDGTTTSSSDDAGVSLLPPLALSAHDGGHAVTLGHASSGAPLSLLAFAMGGADASLREIVSPPVESGRLLSDFAVAPGGRHVVYALERPDGIAEAYAASLVADGGPPVPLPGAENPVLSAAPVAVSPDGTRAVVSFDDLDGRQIVGVDLETGEASALVAPNPLRRLVYRDVTFTPDGETVLYLGNNDHSAGLYRVRFDGAEPVRLSGSRPVRQFAISPDGATALYLSDEERPGALELFVVDVETGARVRVNGGMQDGGDVIAFAFVGNDAALYVADAAVDGAYELFFRRQLQARGEGLTAMPTEPGIVDDPSVIARWFFDLDGPATVPDSTLASPLTILYTPNLVHEPSPAGPSVRWQRADAGGMLRLTLSPVSAIHQALHEHHTLTFELIVALDAAGDEARLLHIGDDHDIGGPSLVYSGDEGRLLLTTGSPRTGYWWPVRPEELRHAVVTVVVDTHAVQPGLRARLFLNGVLRSGAHTHPADRPALALEERFDLGPAPGGLPFRLVIGNRAAGDRSVAGAISYAAIYSRALTHSEVRMNVERLLRRGL